MLPTGQCYQWDKIRTPRDRVTKIFFSQQDNVTYRTMLTKRQSYRRENIINGIMLPTGQKQNTKRNCVASKKMLPTGQCYWRDNVTDRQCYWRDKSKTLRDKVTSILCCQQENVTNGTMLLTGQCYWRDNVTDGTMLPTGQCYRWDKGRTLRHKVTKILCSQQVNVTNGTMLPTRQRQNTTGQRD